MAAIQHDSLLETHIASYIAKHNKTKHNIAKRCARRSIHHPTKMCSETPCATTTDNRSIQQCQDTFFVAGTIASFDKAYSSIRPSSGLADRRARHCGMRTEPVQVPISHHTYTLEIHHRLSASVESNVSACGRPRRTRKRCIRLPP